MMEVYERQVRKFVQKKVLEFDEGLEVKNFLFLTHFQQHLKG